MPSMSYINAVTLSSLLRNRIFLSSINQIKQTHLQILIHGFLPNVTLQTDLLLAYSKCRYLEDAQRVFDKMTDRNMHSWNILISSYVQNSLYRESLRIFHQFLKLGFRPDHFTFPSVYKACTGIGELSCFGCSLHSLVIKLGFNSHVIVGSSILDFYAKGGILVDAGKMFAEMTLRDTVVWNAMISGFTRAGLSIEALACLRDMQREGMKMDSRTIPSILSACGREGDLMRGKEVHGQVVKSIEFKKDVAIGNSLIDMYAKCGCLDISQKVFDNMSHFNLVTWTTLISCHGVHGKGEQSLLLFEKMRGYGFLPNSITFTAVLASCSHSGLINQGKEIFDFMSTEYGIEPCLQHYACMVDLLGRSGCLEEALELIKKIPQVAPPSVWGALLGACRIHKNIVIGEIAASQLFELEPGNSSNYIALCSIYESVGREDGISRIRLTMRELGLVKTPGCSSIIIKGRVRSFYQGDMSHRRTKIVCETLDRIIRRMMLPGVVG
ncbi:hypothetical protein AQUCO_02200322v1 [Aquilegia coerulea]|uniref:Pentacotripeptide-repeat region of PRORP domain-containing protein n=1 Tax=Aquilegia coerulea TaxID=218851 RepID=A0A2G5DE54_AQUCA|nr:hypothetical protein AQUCO_02200322v1 [Aquilegia coerulea]